MVKSSTIYQRSSDLRQSDNLTTFEHLNMPNSESNSFVDPGKMSEPLIIKNEKEKVAFGLKNFFSKKIIKKKDSTPLNKTEDEVNLEPFEHDNTIHY
jgi:hypothetical protein